MKKSSPHLAIFYVFFVSAILITVLHFLYHPVRVLGMDKSVFYMDEQITLTAFYTIVVPFLTGFIVLSNIEKLKSILDKVLGIFLGLFFIFLSIDEYFEIHEYLNGLVKLALRNTQMGHLAKLSWIFPFSLAILLVFIFFILLIIREKNYQVKIPLLLGLGCYGLVLVAEVLGARTFGQSVYVTYVGIEEGLEMISASFFFLSSLNKFLPTPGVS